MEEELRVAETVGAEGLNPVGAEGNGTGGNGTGGNGVGENGAGENGAGNNGGGDNGADLSPLQFLLRVMNDPEATPKQRIKAARAAARYRHVVVPPDKMAAVDEYGFAISRALADAIKEDWFALRRLYSSKDASRRAEILARRAERDKLLRCPPCYTAERDLKRQDELLGKTRRSRAEETELAFVVARLTAWEATSPEGQIRRRIADLRYAGGTRQIMKEIAT